jgi:hypothetical protein
VAYITDVNSASAVKVDTDISSCFLTPEGNVMVLINTHQTVPVHYTTDGSDPDCFDTWPPTGDCQLEKSPIIPPGRLVSEEPTANLKMQVPSGQATVLILDVEAHRRG